MESNTPASYKNYLPSKKIQVIIGVLVIIGIGYFTIPALINYFKNKKIDAPVPTRLSIVLPAGDPTTRDSDGDGVLDWQEIAVGLDPQNPTTRDTTSDLEIFTTLKSKIGEGTFNLELENTEATDKISLTIYDSLSRESIAGGGISEMAVQSITAQELTNYIAAQQDKIKVYTASEVSIVESTQEANDTYAKTVQDVIKNTPQAEDLASTVTSYLDNEISKTSVEPYLSIINSVTSKLVTAEIPRNAAQIHLEILNALQAIYQLTSEYPEGTTDPLIQLGTTTLVQDALIRVSKSVGMLSIYLSVALNDADYSE